MNNYLTNTLQSIEIRPSRGLGGLYPDVVIEEAHDDSITKTEHPVEDGANISDHAYVNPPVVVIRAGVSDSGGSLFSAAKPSMEFYEKLLALQRSLEPFDIITGKRTYKNMLLDRLSVVTDVDTNSVLSFVAECSQIIIAQTQTVSVPPRSVHKNPGKTGGTSDKGQKQPKEKDPSVMKKGSKIFTGY